jgi:GNAT superfamily N-acetyltransferase
MMGDPEMVDIQRAGVKDHGNVTGLLLKFVRSQGLELGTDRDRWERIVADLLDSDGWLFLLAFDGDEPVGLAAVNWYLTLYGSTVDGRLLAVIVEEDNRGTGVGTMLVEEVLRAARRRGCTELEVELRKDDAFAEFLRKFAPDSEKMVLSWICSDGAK